MIVKNRNRLFLLSFLVFWKSILLAQELSNLDKGLQKENDGKYKEAIDFYTQHLSRYVNDTLALFHRGVCFYVTNSFEKAEGDITKYLKYNKKNCTAYNLRANIYVSLKRTHYAFMDFDAAIKLNSKFQDAYFNRGFLYAQLDSNKKALDDYNKVIEIDSTDADAFYSKGLVCKKIGHEDDAIKEFNLAIRRKVDYWDAYYERAVLLKKKTRYSDALSDFYYLMKNNYFNTIEVLKNISFCEFQLGHNGEGCKYLGQIVTQLNDKDLEDYFKSNCK